MKSDIELVQEAQLGSTSAFSELVARYQRLMMKVALRLTRDLSAAEDVVQDSFIKAFQKLQSFEGRSSFRGWMYQITMNTARNKLREGGKVSTGVDHLVIAVSGFAVEKLEEADLQEILQAEIEKLPERQRQALTLRIFDDLSFKEIADIMDCPYDTAKANYRHALLKIRQRLVGNRTLRTWNRTEGLGDFHLGSRTVEVEG